MYMSYVSGHLKHFEMNNGRVQDFIQQEDIAAELYTKGPCFCQTIRLRPKIENSVSNLLKLLENTKPEDQSAIFSEISILSKALRKLEGWIKNPRHPERPQTKYLTDGLSIVKESARFTQRKIDEVPLKNVFGWTDEQFQDFVQLVEKTDKLRFKLFETIKLRHKNPAKPEVKDTEDYSFRKY